MDELTLDSLRARTPDELQQIVERAQDELRSLHINEQGALRELTEDEQKRWDTLLEIRNKAVELLDKHEEIIKIFESWEQRDRRDPTSENRTNNGRVETAFGAEHRDVQVMTRVDPWGDGAEVRSLTPGEVRDRALKVMELSEHTAHLGGVADEVRTHIDRLLHTRTINMDGDLVGRLLLATQRAEYRSAFRTYLAYGAAAPLTREEILAVREVNEYRNMSSTDSAGGYAVPVLIDPTIILTAQGHPNDFFEISRVESIVTNEWRGVTSAGATWYWTSEAVAVTDGSPTLGQPVVPTKKVSGWIPYTVEIGGDYPSFAEEIGRILLEGYSETTVQALTIGNGTTQPKGIVTALKEAPGSQVLVTSDGTLVAEDVYNLWYRLPIRFRSNARWMSSTDVQNAIRQLASGSSNSDANFTVNITQETIPRLFGKPYHVNDYMDAMPTSTTSDCALLIVGDWRHYLIAQRVGMTTEVVQHVLDTTTGAPTGQRGFWAWARLGADVTTANAFRMLTQD